MLRSALIRGEVSRAAVCVCVCVCVCVSVQITHGLQVPAHLRWTRTCAGMDLGTFHVSGKLRLFWLHHPCRYDPPVGSGLQKWKRRASSPRKPSERGWPRYCPQSDGIFSIISGATVDGSLGKTWSQAGCPEGTRFMESSATNLPPVRTWEALWPTISFYRRKDPSQWASLSGPYLSSPGWGQQVKGFSHLFINDSPIWVHI